MKTRANQPLPGALGSVALLASIAAACGSPPSSKDLEPIFTPHESTGPSVNRVLTVEAADAAAEAGQLVLAIEAESVDRLFGGSFTLTFAPADLEVVEVRPGDLLAGGFLVSSHEGDDAVPGQLMVGFATDEPPPPGSPVSGTIAVVTLQTLSEEPSEVSFAAPSFWLDTRVRALVAADGVGIAGTRWLGGSIDWVEPL